MNIVVIGYGDPFTPSTRFRYYQYQSHFERRGHRLHFLFKSQIESQDFWKSLRAADVIINQKCLLGTRNTERIFSLGKPTYFDFDDAIWTRPGKPFRLLTRYRVQRRFQNWIQKSTGVLVANSFLADKAALYGNHIHLVPMALDINLWKPSWPKRNGDRISLGWNGSPNNLPLLEKLSPTLQQLLSQNQNLNLKVFCGKKPNFPFPFEHHPFDPENETAFVQSLDIGLLPLLEDEYSEGKSPIKGLQYLACGVPVVGQINRGGTSFLTKDTCIKVDTLDEWSPSIKQALADQDLRNRMAKHGVDLVADKHSIDAVFELLCVALQC